MKGVIWGAVHKPALFSESVDSPCRDGEGTPMLPYIGKAYTHTNVEDVGI